MEDESYWGTPGCLMDRSVMERWRVNGRHIMVTKISGKNLFRDPLTRDEWMNELRSDRFVIVKRCVLWLQVLSSLRH